MKKLTSLIIFLSLILSSVCTKASFLGGVYDMAYPFNENGLARVAFSGKWGIINKNEEFVLDNEYDYIDKLSGDRIKFKKGNLFGFLDADFNEVIKAQFAFAEDFSHNLACVQNESGKWGFINKNGENITDFIFDSAHSFADNLALVEKDGLYGYIDENGEMVIPPQFCESYDFSCGLACFKKDDLYGYIDKTGEVKIPPEYSLAWDFCENYAAVKKDELYSFIDTEGNVKISGDYDRATRFSDGLAPVRKKNGKYGLINADGTLAVPHKYDFISEFSNRYASVRIDEKYGYINENGLSVIPCVFDRADSFSDGYAFAVMGEKSGYIDKTGTFIENLRFLDGGKFSHGTANVLFENGLWGYTDLKKTEADENGEKNTENKATTDTEKAFSPDITANNLSAIKIKIGDKKIITDGKESTLSYPPIIEDERTLLPIRAIVEAIGGTVLWEGQTQKITITSADTKIMLTVGSTLAKVNNRIIPIEKAPKIYDGVTLVPLRFVAESLNMSVNWNGETKEIILYY